MTKDDYKVLAALIFGLVIIVGGVMVGDFFEKQYLELHHCKLIHQNPKYTTMEYDSASKTNIPRTHEGKKFYECDDGEWR